MPRNNGEHDANSRWPLPPVYQKPDGSPRHVGVEFELQGLAVEELAGIVAETLGGTTRRISSAEFLVAAPAYGEFRVEIDSVLLKNNADHAASDGEVPSLQEAAAKVLSGVGSLVVPSEVVSPPLPMTRLGKPMEALVTAIRAAGGQGTQRSPLYAFGVHLNVEPPVLEPIQVLDYMRAFVCLYDWIVDAGDVDVTRQLMPYIKRFPAEYEELLADVSYVPDWPKLIDDYLAANATRNRALDMLPLLADVDERRVRDVVDDDLIKPRPAFHYRLANCCVDDPDWSIAEPWRRWLKIEALALDRERLVDCCNAFLKDRQRTLGRFDNQWLEEVQQWLPGS